MVVLRQVMNSVVLASLFAVALFVALLVSLPESTHAAAFGCEVRTSCLGNQTLLIRLNSTAATSNNSHAQLANFSGAAYPYSVCCWTDSFRTMTNGCVGSYLRILGLYNTTDSHVQQGNYSTYPESACLNVTSGNISCEYKDTSCTSGFSGVVSIASSEATMNQTNDHVGEFPYYLHKVCCQVGGQSAPIVAYVNISPNGTATTRMDLECQNGSVSDQDGDSVTLHYNWIKNATSITLLNLPMDYDATAGVTHDISGNGNHGVVTNATFLPTGGKIGGGFNTTPGYLNVSRSLGTFSNTTNFTLAAWVYSSNPGGIQIVLVINSSTNDFAPFIGQDAGYWEAGASKSGVGSDYVRSSDAVPPNSWTYIVGVFGNGQVQLYMNGTSQGSTSYTGTYANSAVANTKGWNVGLMVYNDALYFGHVGLVDEVMIFNRSLSPSEILTLYNGNNRFLNSTELRRSEGWNCSITPVDSTGLNGTTKFSNMTRINGSAPLAPNLTYPLNNNLTAFERMMNFSWTAADERDGDQVNYTLNLSVAGGSCGFQGTVSNFQTTNYTYGELCTDQLYNWTVRACDIDGCALSTEFNFTVLSILSITLLNNNTNFGTLGIGQTIDTQYGGVAPFLIENNGNVVANVTIYGNNSPFTSVSLGTTAFQFKARLNETGAFNTSATGGSQMTYAPVQSAYLGLLRDLNYSDVNDAAYIDINVTVPASEPPGTKGANITFQATRSQ